MSRIGNLETRLLSQAFFLLAVFALYGWITLPGLYGGFILDDDPNLARLQEVKTTGDLWPYIFSGIGQLGRPVALFSFALQAGHWPDNPLPFKMVNVRLHLANGILLYMVCALLAKLLRWPLRQRILFSAAVTLFWLFLALHLSTVFYVVQRMTLLAGFFTLLGILCFLYGYYLSEASIKAYAGKSVATLGMIIGYGAGVLSKENAILLGFYIAILYFVLLRPQRLYPRHAKFWDKWVAAFALAPPAAVLSYLFYTHYGNDYSSRGFTFNERLLTEPVILWDYVGKIFFPTTDRLNLFNDGFPLSQNLLDPPATLMAIAAWLGLLMLAFWKRNNQPYLLFALLWFLAGHSLESSFLPLELYFEHRNYLPSLGPVIALSAVACSCLQSPASGGNVNASLRKVLAALLTAAIGWNFWITGEETKAWSSPDQMTLSALAERPESMRARLEGVEFFANHGDHQRAAALLQSIEQKWPGRPGTYSQFVMLNCRDPNVKTPAFNKLEQRLKTGRFDQCTVDALHQISDLKNHGYCLELDWDHYRTLLSSVLENPQFSLQYKMLAVLMAASYNVEKNYSAAAKAMDILPEAQADIDFLILKMQFYALAGLDRQALEIAERIRARFVSETAAWSQQQQQLAAMEQVLRHKIATTAVAK